MKLIVKPHITEIKKDLINEKEINLTECEFEFSEEYTADLVKEAIFTYEGNSYKEIIANNKCSIPPEVIDKKGTVEIGVVAYKVEDEEYVKRFNPSPVYFSTLIGSLKDKYKNSQPITPSELEQYEQALEDGLQEVANVDIDAEETQVGADITITNRQGTSKTVSITNGKDGKDGETGASGVDGVGISSVEKTSTEGLVDTYTITYTDGDTDTFTVTNGKKGNTGSAGADGVSPTIATSKSGKTTTITITDKEGTKTATILDGNDGSAGQDGHSPVVTATKTNKVTTIYVDGSSIATINDGNDGQNGQDGQDYVLTNQDKTDIANIVIGMLPTWTGGSY